MPETKHVLRIAQDPTRNPQAFLSELNRLLAQIADSLDQIYGHRGQPTLYADLEIQDHALLSYGKPMVRVADVVKVPTVEAWEDTDKTWQPVITKGGKLSDLKDVEYSPAQEDEWHLAWDEDRGVWHPVEAPPENLGDLADVELAGLADGHIINYDSATETWVNIAKPSLVVAEPTDVTATRVIGVEYTNTQGTAVYVAVSILHT